MTDFERLTESVANLYAICGRKNYGDPFASGRLREMILAEHLGHKICDTLHGADAYGADGYIREYKTTSDNNYLKGRYDVSFYTTWKEQKEYLITKKLGSCKYHYFALFTYEQKLKQIWVMHGDKVMEILFPKIKKSWDSLIKREYKKHPALYGTVTKSEIEKFGAKIYDNELGLDLCKEHNDKLDISQLREYHTKHYAPATLFDFI